jgi:hypothetical protein
MNDAPDLERIGRLADKFLRTDYGKYVVQALAEMAYGLHEQAEGKDDPNEIAGLIKRAAGVRDVINFITTPATMYRDGSLTEQVKENEEEDDELAMP